MKHTLKVSILLIIAFLFSQIIGLAIINSYVDVEKTIETGEIKVEDLPYNLPRPTAEGGGSAIITIISAVLIGTILIFLIMKFGDVLWWKIWFFMAVSFCLLFAFKAFMPSFFASILAVALAGFKIFKPNIFIHNISELFVYGGLAALIVPLFNNPETNILWAFALLVIISIYDMIAVWKSKHMIKLAKFQTKSKVFAGLLIPYQMPGHIKNQGKARLTKIKTAILGGGDMGFPLFFSGIVMQNLVLENIDKGISNFLGMAYLKALIIPVFVAIALLILLVKSKKDKFYPAMPFLTAGCIVGYIVLKLVSLI